MLFHRVLILVALLFPGVLVCEAGQIFVSPYQAGPGKYPRFDSKQAEPGLAYGSVEGFPLPKTILFSVSTDELTADAAEWKSKGFDAFFLTGVMPDWSADIWAIDNESWTIGSGDKTFQKVKHACEICRGLGVEVFLTMAWSHPFDWFDDMAWRKIEDNFRQFAVFAQATGCTGVAIDIEYINQQYHFNWPGYTYAGYTRKELVGKLHARAEGIAEVIYNAFPDAVLLTFPEGTLSLGSVVQAAWVAVAARHNAPGGVHLCTEYTYRRPNIRYMLADAWLNNRLMQTLLTPEEKSYWETHCSLAEGLWPFGEDPDDYHGAAPSLEEFRQAYAASLMASRRYNWVYSHDRRPAMLGRPTEKAVEGIEDYMKVMKDRQIVQNDAYVQAAKDLRAMVLRDYSRDLGVSLVASFAGPREEGEVGLMPVSVIEGTPLQRMQPILWDLDMRIQQGAVVSGLRDELGTQTRWMVLGPFPNTEGQGYNTVFSPEKGIHLEVGYEGVQGTIRWTELPHSDSFTIDLTRLIQPNEQVCAYALCYVHSPADVKVQIRLGANDTCKLWVGGSLLLESPNDGRVLLDKEIVETTLPAGVTPILLKVCNNKKDWGFVFRITDEEGNHLKDLKFSTTPE